ncbi:MAG: glutamine--tRNA ligase/YqeY domain fusion protein [Deltaproteobacteria bacterium]|nr:glutamine--tRNA ligase/YqeY domain fusion protein [Deltaproteobacteria bacterium]
MNRPGESTPQGAPASNFIRDIVKDDLESGRHDQIRTRFPPEPNGYLHIGHAKAICLSFGLAREFGGTCNLRFDDTNPTTEDMEYVESIKEDIRWLGFEWEGDEKYTSDYFEQLYEWAELLIRDGKAYVDSLPEDRIRELRGDYYKKGTPSPFRDRTVDENLDLFRRMRAGEFPDGAHVLRARIGLDSQNMNMRDPLMYRIRHAVHHRTGDEWCIYPMYDWAHGQSDAIERITHSLCSLEFEAHRPLYEWFLEQLPAFRSRQIEFARLNLTYTVMSKRKLLELVNEGRVNGWDDPRMPTLCGMRRRGYPPEAIRDFAERIGVSKRDSTVDVALLEHAVRDRLNDTSPRVMAVLRPLKVVIDNWPDGRVEEFDAPYHPKEPDWGSRKVPFGKVIFIERDDFREEAPRKWFRLAPGREVRLRYACLITCVDVVRDASGEVVELHCTWDPESRGGRSPDGRKVKGTLHGVSAEHGIPAVVRLYERLFDREDPMDCDEGEDWKDHLNPDSIETLEGALVEPSLARVEPGSRWQFERLGYFCADSQDHRPGAPVFNRTVTLRDTWARIEKRSG